MFKYNELHDELQGLEKIINSATSDELKSIRNSLNNELNELAVEGERLKQILDIISHDIELTEEFLKKYAMRQHVEYVVDKEIPYDYLGSKQILQSLSWREHKNSASEGFTIVAALNLIDAYGETTKLVFPLKTLRSNQRFFAHRYLTDFVKHIKHEMRKRFSES